MLDMPYIQVEDKSSFQDYVKFSNNDIDTKIKLTSCLSRNLAQGDFFLQSYGK